MQPSILPPRQQNVIYFYDLPKNDYTSTKLATLIKNKSGVDVQQPQVRRDINKPFYTAVIRIDNPDQFERVKIDFRYFNFESKQCRALPYCQDLLGINLPKLKEQNVFVRKIDKAMSSEALENYFKAFGGIISCKVSLDEKHTSRGYGFVCFQDSEYAKEALKATANKESLIGIPFNPKSRTDQRKAFNNIFVKNLPTDVNDDEIRALFGPYGNISSLHRGQSSKDPSQKFYFVCFTSPNKDDIEYGPRCAQKAVDELHGKDYKGQKLYVHPALKKEERQKELEHETLKYKSSKKRCNLYVKGFVNENEQELRSVFGQFGEIESLRVFEAKDGKSPYAFVCYKTPDQAQAAKNAQNLIVNNRPLYVNHYEIKQYRDLKNEDNKDKQDFQRHLQETGQGGPVDARNMDQITQIIKQLMAGMGGQRGPQQPNFNQGGYNNRPQQFNNDQRQRNYANNQGRGGYQGGQNRGYQQTQPPVNRGPAHIPMPQQTAPPVPNGGMFQATAVVPSQHPLSGKFYSVTVPILGAVNEHNPNYKQTVGSAIFEFVQNLVEAYAPKVTGMLIDLPVVEIQKYMVNFDLFFQRVTQATTLLTQQNIVAVQH